MKHYHLQKILALFIILSMLFSFSGCSFSPDNTSSKKSAWPDTSATIEETVIYEQSGISITAKSLTYKDGNAVIEFAFKNDTDLGVVFSSTSHFAINKLILAEDAYLTCTVYGGKIETSTLKIDLNKLMLYGIYTISSFEIDFSIKEAYQTVRTGPLEIKTKTSGTSKTPSDAQIAKAMKNGEYNFKHFSREKLYDNNGIEILSWGIAEDYFKNTLLLLEVENKSSDKFFFKPVGFSINDLRHEAGISSTYIPVGYKALVPIDLSPSYKEIWTLCGLEDIETISLDFATDSYQGNDTITMTVPNVRGTYDTSGPVIYADGKTKIILKGIIDSGSDLIPSVSIVFMVQSNWDAQVSLSRSLLGDMFINDQEIYYPFSSDLLPGKHSLVIIQLNKSELNDADITQASDINNFSIDLEITTPETSIWEPLRKFRVEYTVTN